MHGVHIHALWVGADEKSVTMGFKNLCHNASLSQHNVLCIVLAEYLKD
jgi:hypothetical protein